jgi:hypothetical protein
MRTVLVLLIAGSFILLLILTIKVASIDRSLRRIEHEERRSKMISVIRPFSSWQLLEGRPSATPARTGAKTELPSPRYSDLDGRGDDVQHPEPNSVSVINTFSARFGHCICG